MTTRILQLIFCTFILAAACAADTTPVFTLTLIPPSGDITGAPGETIGWGYTIANLSGTDYLSLTNLDAGTFLNGAATGLFDFPILPPGKSQTETLDPGLPQGLFELTWDPAAPVGFINSGDFTVTADWYDGDPFADGAPIAGLTGVTQSQHYSATVTPASTVATPEPGTLLPILAAIAIGRGARTRACRVRTLANTELAKEEPR